MADDVIYIMISEQENYSFRLSEFFPDCSLVRDGCFNTLDEANASTPGSLIYCQNLHYLQEATANGNVSAIICTPPLVHELNGLAVSVASVQDPRYGFFDLYVKLKAKGYMQPSMDFGMGVACSFHQSAVISPKSKIGDRVTIGANSIIGDYCIIGDDVEIDQNVVIGAEGLLTVRQPNGHLLRVAHAGGVEIGQGAQILSGTVIVKSLFQRFTRVGEHSQIGIMSNIGHGAHVGNFCVISGNSVIAGRSHIGDNVWMGASTSVAQGLNIGSNAQIKMGSVVVSDVDADAVISGNFAMNHRLNVMRYLKDKKRI